MPSKRRPPDPSAPFEPPPQPYTEKYGHILDEARRAQSAQRQVPRRGAALPLLLGAAIVLPMMALAWMCSAASAPREQDARDLAALEQRRREARETVERDEQEVADKRAKQSEEARRARYELGSPAAAPTPAPVHGKPKSHAPAKHHAPKKELTADERAAKLWADLEKRQAKEAKKAGIPPGGCCKHCSKGVPCGDSCIPAGRTCHKGPGCAC